SEIREVSKDANALKIASSKFLQIEQALGMWISTAEQKQLILTGEDTVNIETIKNCWHHTRILPLEHLVRIFPEMELASDKDPETQIVQIPEVTIALYETQELIDLTNDIYLQQITQEYFDNYEFIDTEEALDDEQIIELVKKLVVNNNEPDNSVDEEPKITFIEVKKNLNQLLSFIHQQSFMTDSFIKEIMKHSFMIFFPEHIELLLDL
ncbi:7174_t:CDS:2, partial [Gigaspora margarita]